MSFTYSVVIRTLGNTGDKYRCTLDAIERQTVKPAEIVVVIPQGYTLDHSIGTEKIVYSKKGMVSQRAEGIAQAQSDYLLVIDDDIDFPDDFVEKMFQAMQEQELDCVLAPGNWSRTVPVTGQGDGTADTKEEGRFQRWKYAFTGRVFYSRRKSKYYDAITRTAGHRVYVRCEDGLCQTGCFQCFFIKANTAKAARFDDDLWLEQGSITSYAAYDDSVFFYKCFLNGGRIAYTGMTDYAHLDAAAGRQTKDRLTAKRIRLYSIARNRTIFWRRYIWPNRRGLLTLLGGAYGIVNYAVYNIIVNLAPKNWPAIGALLLGYHEAFHYHK